MAITVKKKTLKLKSDAPAEGAGEQPAADEPQPVLATMGTPSSVSQIKGGSFVLSFIMGLIACAVLGALVAIQFIENSYYTGMVP
ncbi:MAG: hypothetical protein ISS31_05145 [Kiritimatiellae bacterium]|nr:hypothetical protein [Kiritimatiellia bacterium]